MTDDPRQKLAEIAQAAERDIDAGTIKLTGAAADRELARLAEQKHAATFGERPGDLRDLVEGLLGKETPESRAAIARYFAPPSVPPSTQLAAAVGELREGARDERKINLPGSAQHADELDAVATWLEALQRAPADDGVAVHVEVPEGFVPVQVFANREIRQATFNRKAFPVGNIVPFPSEREAEALAFCFRIALEHDHGGAKRLRRLLFAWFNADELGGFDLADLWSLDEEYRGHALTLISMIARSPVGWYPEHYGYAADMLAIVDTYHARGRAVRS